LADAVGSIDVCGRHESAVDPQGDRRIGVAEPASQGSHRHIRIGRKLRRHKMPQAMQMHMWYLERVAAAKRPVIESGRIGDAQSSRSENTNPPSSTATSPATARANTR
jgi:hypothetical protein